jgi:hypothetical protein
MEEQNHAESYEDQDLPMCLWAEAVITVSYVHLGSNQLSHSALGF